MKIMQIAVIFIWAVAVLPLAHSNVIQCKTECAKNCLPENGCDPSSCEATCVKNEG